MSILSRIKNFRVFQVSELQRLELQYRTLGQRKVKKEMQGYSADLIEAEMDEVFQRIQTIQASKLKEQEQEKQFLREAYAELDEEFPVLKRIAEGDRGGEFE